MEVADPTFVWTPEGRRLSAMAHLTISAVEAGVLTGEEALLLTLNPPAHPDLDAKLDEVAEMLERREQGRPSWTDEQRAKQSDRRRRLYAEDPEYREREKARKRDKTYRDKEYAAREARRKKNIAAGRDRDGAIL